MVLKCYLRWFSIKYWQEGNQNFVAAPRKQNYFSGPVVDTPCLGMVDDILCVQKCSKDTVQMNAVVNAFIEGKKLNLSSKKCHRIHVKNKKARNELKCPEVKIHNGKMNDAIQEKYLGDLINTSGTCTKTIEERRIKAFGIVNEIIAILIKSH